MVAVAAGIRGDVYRTARSAERVNTIRLVPKARVKVHVHALRGKLCRKLQQRRGADAAAHQRDGAAQRAVHGKPTARGARQRNGVPGPQRGQLLRARTTDLI